MDFLKRFFKSREDNPWRQFSREIGADYIESWFLGRDKVVATVKNRIIIFEHDIYFGGDHIGNNRVFAHYVSKDGFQFNIYHKGVFSKLCKLLGMRVNIKVGYPEFERNFIVKSNDEFKVRALLANSIIRQLIIQSLSAVDSFSLNRQGLTLSFRSMGFESVARLRSFYELFEETLNCLSDMDSTHETDMPSVEYTIL